MEKSNKYNKICHFEDVEQSVYDYQKQYTSGFNNEYAYRFYKKNIPYQVSKNQIENIAKILHGHSERGEIGVKPGEVVAVISPMLPEVISSFYGISKNGAVFFPIDPRTNATRIRDFLNLAGVKKVFVLDMAYGKLDAIIDHTNVENVIVISATDSMYKAMSILYRVSQMKKTKNYYKSIDKLGFDDPIKVKELVKDYESKKDLSFTDRKMIQNLKLYEKTRDLALKNLYYTNPPKTGYISFEDAIKDASTIPDFDSIYDENVPASLTLTSGTTGKPKVVPTMNRSYNVKVRDYSYTTMPIGVGDRILSMPPFILYGEIFMHMAYVRGVQNVVIPDITAYYYPKVIMNEKISHAVGVPSQALTLAEDKKFNMKKPKTLKSVSVGGTKMLREHEKTINESLNKMGTQVFQGYSMSELTPASMTNMPNAARFGSVGKPIGDTKPLIVNPNTLEVLGNNENGTLLVKSETQFTGYYKNESESAKVFIDIDGDIYVNTGDQAYVDDDGYYFIQGRDKEMIIRPDGHNNFPSEMEELIASHPFVEDCAVVGVPYPNYDNPVGEYPKAHVVLKEVYRGNEDIIEEELRKLCSDNLPERDVPYYYQFHDSLPLTPVLKVDKLKLSEIDKEQFTKSSLEKVLN